MNADRSMKKTDTLLKLRKQYVPNCFAQATGIVAGDAVGSRITDVDGNTYIDFGAGIAVVNAGNCHPAVVEAVKRQAERSFHTCFHIVMQENYIRLAENLAKMTPGDFPKKAMFLNSGAEAVENVIKLARVFTKRRALIAPEYGFHGRTYGALSLTSKTKPLKAGLEPFMPEVYRMPFPHSFRKPSWLTPEEYGQACLDKLEEMFTTTVPAESVAGIILEPVLGEGGIIIPPDGYLKGLRNICDRHGILLIFDEIQTGFGRAGEMFVSERFGVVPDIITLGKALGNGLPISAVVARSEIMDAPAVGALGSTYGGNPIAVAAGLAMLDVLKKEKLPQRAKKTGAAMLKRLKALEETYDFVGDVRGIGMMFGIELVDDMISKKPDKARATAIITACADNGLIVTRAGAFGNVIRLLPPLNIPDNDIEAGLSIIENVFEKAAGR